MQFATPRPKEPRESVVPMINVVFLLLVFLLITAEMTPPPPLDVTPPEALAEPVTPGEVVLHIAADGTLALGPLRGEAALSALPEGGTLTLRADAGLEAAVLAALMPRLAAGRTLRLVTGSE
jgi:biopolymer transport protein ExbD